MKTVALSQGKRALVDDVDFELVNQWKWSFAKDRWNTNYAQTNFQVEPPEYRVIKRTGRLQRKQRSVSMHRLLMGFPLGLQVDHINGDGLDNRRDNLRLATPSQNQANTGKQCDNTSGFKGVSLNRNTGLYDVSMRFNGPNKRIGSFSTPEEGAMAYDRAALGFHREFAKLNFPQAA